MNIQVHQRIAGTTIAPTWVNSGVTPDTIESRLYDRTESVVSSHGAVSSGNGLYFALHTLPTTPNVMYIQEWRATIGGYPYIDRQFVRAIMPEAD